MEFFAVVCEEGHVRLFDGPIVSQGRAEVCVNNTWWRICDEENNHQLNANRDLIICRTLGYTNTLLELHRLLPGLAPPLLRDWACIGNESSLLNCSYTNIMEIHCDVAGLACENVVGRFIINSQYIYQLRTCTSSIY